MEDRKDFNPDDLLDRATDSVLSGPIPDVLPSDQVAQLAAAVQHAANQPNATSLVERIKNMKPRTRFAVAAAALIAVVGLTSWLELGSGAALAFGDVAEALTNVRSARWKTTSVVKWPQSEAKTAHGIGMFLAPSHERMERIQDGQKSIMIWDGSKDKATALAPEAKTATVMTLKNLPKGHPLGTSFLQLRESVLNAKNSEAGKAESLGVKVIDGQKAEGFRTRHGDLEVTIWADPKSSLPIRVETVTSGEIEVRIVRTDFEVDVDLDESLFSLAPPEGFTVRKMQLDLPQKPLVMLARTLGTAAECNAGVFPPTLRGEQGIEGIMPRIAGVWEKKYGKGPPKGAGAAAMQKAVGELAMNMGGAIAILNGLSPEHDWHYAGKDVKLNAPNRAIFWWRPRNSDNYEVIYADLSVKDVAPQDLPKAPPSEGSPKRESPRK